MKNTSQLYYYIELVYTTWNLRCFLSFSFFSNEFDVIANYHAPLPHQSIPPTLCRTVFCAVNSLHLLCLFKPFFFTMKKRQTKAAVFCTPYYSNRKDISIKTWSLFLLILPTALKSMKSTVNATKLQARKPHYNAWEGDRTKQKLFLF